MVTFSVIVLLIYRFNFPLFPPNWDVLTGKQNLSKKSIYLKKNLKKPNRQCANNIPVTGISPSGTGRKPTTLHKKI